MAGTYAHIILAGSLCRETALLRKFPKTIREALKNYAPFCKLGSVGPDCPYVVGSSGATGYANVMHYVRTADFVRIAIPRIYSMNFGLSDTRACLAWIFGYTAHLVMDLTLQPVISRKFGIYADSAQNRKKHRLCELNQDVFLFHKRFGKEIVGSDFLAFSNFGECSDNGNLHKLSPAIRELWIYILEQYPRAETKIYVRFSKESLKPDVWFATFVNVFQNLVTKGNPFLQGLGLGYPRVRDLDPIYTQDLLTPSEEKIDYEALFSIAAGNVRRHWLELALALDNNQPDLFTLPNASVDTGLADATGQGGIPDRFLRDVDVPEDIIQHLRPLIRSDPNIQWYSCFISYSTKDEEFARRLKSRMKQANMPIWFAPEDLEGGKKLQEQLFRAIQLYDKLLLVLSQHSLQSEWVMTEIRKAREIEKKECRRKLFPIRLVDFGVLRAWTCFDADTGKDLAIEVREYFIPDFSDWKDDDAFDEAFKRLQENLIADK